MRQPDEHLEHEPAVTGVDRCEIEDVTEELPVRLCIPAVDDDVRAVIIRRRSQNSARGARVIPRQASDSPNPSPTPNGLRGAAPSLGVTRPRPAGRPAIGATSLGRI